MANHGVTITVDGDFTLMNSGSHSRFSDTIQYLSSNQLAVTVYSYRNHPSAPWTSASEARFSVMFPGAALVLEDCPASVVFLGRLKRVALIALPNWASYILKARLGRATPLYEKIVDSGDWLIVNFASTLWALNGVRLDRTIVDTHDIDFIKHVRRTGEPVYSLRVLAKLRAELSALRLCAAVIAISASEERALSIMLDREVLAVPAFDMQESVKATCRNGGYKYDILFIGSNYGFNAPGLLSFLRENSDWLSKWRIAVAGRVCEDKEVRLAVARCDNVEILGYVSSLTELIMSTKLTVSPVNGTGLKIKLLDSLAAGTPALASRQSIEGLPGGYEGAVFPIAQETAEDLLTSDAALAAAQDAAKRYQERLWNSPGKRRFLSMVMT